MVDASPRPKHQTLFARRGEPGIIFWRPEGPLLKYIGGTFSIHDLDPERVLDFRMSRGEMFITGWRCLWAAIKS